MKTEYAPPERVTIERIKEDFQFLKKVEYIEKIINSLPYLDAILNKSRQVVFANKKLLEMFDLEAVENLLGQRPGEVLHCINANREIGGCGTSINCSVCGAVNCILESQRPNANFPALFFYQRDQQRRIRNIQYEAAGRKLSERTCRFSIR